ncbi:MAG: hypothetical protein ABIB43_01200 [archaeon]
MANMQRETAKKCRIIDLLNGRYVKREGWNPNYLETSMGKISRANLMGVIVSNEGTSCVIDDGSGQIQLRTFDETNIFVNKKIGELVLVIGKPKVFNEQKYFVPEIIKKIDNKNWILYRLLELSKIQKVSLPKEINSKKSNEQTISSPTTNLMELVIKKISELDLGQGVRIEDVLSFFNSNETNVLINQLIEQGEVFEIKPGVVKVI